MKFVNLLGRILYSLIFIMSAPGHFKADHVAYAAAAGVPMANILVPLSGVIALLGGLSVLLGYRAKCGAWLLVIFLVPVTLAMHKFWGIPDPMAAQMQMAHFMKNVGLIGAALMITQSGSGPNSLKPE